MLQIVQSDHCSNSRFLNVGEFWDAHFYVAFARQSLHCAGSTSSQVINNVELDIGICPEVAWPQLEISQKLVPFRY